MRTDELLQYLVKRESIRRAKESGLPPPWTDDFILQNFKFTNVKRIHDKTTKHFAKIYSNHTTRPEHEALYNCALYRYFGTTDWADAVGWMNGHDEKWILYIYDSLRAIGTHAFTGAYVITNGGRAEEKQVVVAEYLHGLQAIALKVVAVIESTRTWEAGYEVLKRAPGFGGSGFMAKEVLQDYLIWMDYRNEMLHRPPVDEYITDFYTFTPIGPGARRGLNRMAGRDLAAPVPLQQLANELAAIRVAVSPRMEELFGLKLSAHDIQFGLCEFDKYERFRLGQGRPKSRYVARQTGG